MVRHSPVSAPPECFACSSGTCRGRRPGPGPRPARDAKRKGDGDGPPCVGDQDELIALQRCDAASPSRPSVDGKRGRDPSALGMAMRPQMKARSGARGEMGR